MLAQRNGYAEALWEIWFNMHPRRALAYMSLEQV